MQQQPLGSGTSWSGLENNSDNEEIIDSEDFGNGQSSPERCDDASFIVKNQSKSADDQLTVGSGKESDSGDSSEHDSDDFTARTSFAGKNGRVQFTTCPHHQEHVQVILDTPTKTNWCCKNHPK